MVRLVAAFATVLIGSMLTALPVVKSAQCSRWKHRGWRETTEIGTI